MGFPDISRRQLLISGVISGLIGAGVTGSSGLNSIEGNVSVQAQQTIDLTSVTTASAESDTSFTNIGDGDTSFGAAVELNNGDSTEIFIDLRNSSSVALKTRAIIKQPSPLSVSPRIADDDDLQGDNTVVQTGKDTYVFTIPAQRIVRFVLRISVPDTASPGASDVRISFDPLSTNKDEQPSTDSGPKIEDARLFDTADEDGVVSDGETVRIEATVTEFNGLKLVTTDASEFDPELGPVTLTDDGPGVSQSDDKFSAEFVVGENADEGTDRTVDIKATDNEGVETEETANSLVVRNVETDNDAPTISSVSLSDETDSDGVVSDGDRVKIEATVEDAANAGEITEVTADASDFGAGDVELSNTDTSEDNEAGGGGERIVSETFAVGESGTASKGTGQTVTITATDENDDSASTTTGSLEVDNAAPTISSVSLSDETDSDGVVSTGDTVEVQTTVKDAETAQEITEVTADASDFGVKETVTLYSSSPPGGNPDEGTRTESATFTVGSDATEGTGQTVTLTVEDENGNEVIKIADKFGETLEVDNDAPTISGVTLSDETDSDGVVSKDDEVKVTATIKDATNAGEITEVTVDASDFGVEETVTLYSSSPPSGNPDGGIRTESVTFTVGSDATEGTGQTVTLTVEDENSDKDTNVNAANKFSETLEVDNAAPTISSVSLTDQTDEDGDVDPGDTVRITATVTDDNQIENVEAEASTAGSFDLDSTPVTLTDGGPGASTSDDTFGAEFNVGDNPDTGDQSVTVTVTDEAGNTKDQESNLLTVGSG